MFATRGPYRVGLPWSLRQKSYIRDDDLSTIFGHANYTSAIGGRSAPSEALPVSVIIQIRKSRRDLVCYIDVYISLQYCSTTQRSLGHQSRLLCEDLPA